MCEDIDNYLSSAVGEASTEAISIRQLRGESQGVLTPELVEVLHR